jgi:hypothetical protein
MELGIWLTALTLSALISLLALFVLAFRTFSLAKKLKPFVEHLKRFKVSAAQYPEAVKLFSDMAKAEREPATKRRSAKR